MQKILKVDNIMYRVSDLQKAKEFYEKILGLRKVWEDENTQMVGFILEQGGSEIVVHNNPNIPQFDYSYLVEDVVIFCAEIKEKRGNVLLDPIDVRSGKYAIIGDQDGNAIPVIDLTKFGGKPKYD